MLKCIKSIKEPSGIVTLHFEGGHINDLSRDKLIISLNQDLITKRYLTCISVKYMKTYIISKNVSNQCFRAIFKSLQKLI